MLAVETESLSKRFGDQPALHGVSLRVPCGGVVGLVGPNGSGKSTLIRILLGLLRASEGTARVLGCDIGRPAGYLDRVGALIEGPAFVPALSARANLVSLARLRSVPARRVDEVLRIVGLQGRADEPVRRYSLGMKQRLGIAVAMLTDPQLLILDEPTNGLDPAGIVEIRSLLRHLGSDGRTVIVSSHQLSELEAVCDHVVVVRFGDVLFSGPTSELLGRGRSTVLASPEIPSDLGRLAAALAQEGWSVEQVGSHIRVAAGADQAARINRVASGAGVTLATLIPQQPNLEEIFLAMTGADDGELARGRAGTGRAA